MNKLLFLIALFLASCAAQNPPLDVQLTKAVKEFSENMRLLNCGYSGVLGQTVGKEAVTLGSFNGNAIKACAVPSASEIERACAKKHVKVTPAADVDASPKYEFQTFRVRNVTCRFSNSLNDHANCGLEVHVGENSDVWRSHDISMVYIFRDLSDDVAHDFYVTSWETESACLPSLESR
jgi:hypothetical protein